MRFPLLCRLVLATGWGMGAGCGAAADRTAPPPAVSAGDEDSARGRPGSAIDAVRTTLAAEGEAAVGPWGALVASEDRAEQDRALDAGRRPAELLAFMGIAPGMRVAEIAAGTGYTTELLARAVGEQGRVYAVNNRFVLERFAEGPWSERLKKGVMKNVTRLDREFDDPLPAEVSELDLVCNILFYHDSVWMQTDRVAMNAAVFRALRPGGTYVVVDHSAATGHGVEDAKTLHRIEAKVVRSEIEAAGFVFVEQSPFLKNSADARDWNAAPSAAADRRGTSDRFALKFRRP